VKANGLASVVFRRIVLFASLAMIAQLAGVVAEYWFDKQQTVQLALERETSTLFKGFSQSAEGPRFDLPRDLIGRYGRANGDSFTRIRLSSGVTLFGNCGEECDRYFRPPGQNAPEFWISWIDLGKPLSFQGGRSFTVGTDKVIIEIGILDGGRDVLFEVLAHEVIDHMVLPMSLMLIVVLGATSLSIDRALRPVEQAAELASTVNPLDAEVRLPTTGMPSEIAKFTNAINRSFDTVRSVVGAQRDFTSAISHEVRTPLAIARLEIEKIEDPRARKVEEDLVSLNHLVEQLTTLARLDGIVTLPIETVDLMDVAEKVVTGIAPIVYDAGKTIELVDEGSKPFPGYPTLIENAIRNLIENAVRHSAAGSLISIVVGPGMSFSVQDKSVGLLDAIPQRSSANGQGLGLKIVHRIAEIHGANFEFRKQPEGVGTIARFEFPANLLN
jgi:signal transduction histidine kinase